MSASLFHAPALTDAVRVRQDDFDALVAECRLAGIKTDDVYTEMQGVMRILTHLLREQRKTAQQVGNLSYHR